MGEMFRNKIFLFCKYFLHLLIIYAIIASNFAKRRLGGDPMATLDDIAQELGVSKATVSKALNGAKDVSKKCSRPLLKKLSNSVIPE